MLRVPAAAIRRRAPAIVSLLLAIAATLACAPWRTMAAATDAQATPAASDWGFPELSRALFRLEPDPGRVARVSHLVLHRDAATITLEEGDLALARPVLGRVCAAYFAGRGRIHVAPAQPVERGQLQRRLKSAEVDQEFLSMVLVFADSTAEELLAAVPFHPGAFKHVRTESPDNLRDFIVEKTEYLDPSFARTLLERRHDRTFAATTLAEDGQRLRFGIDPYESEEVTLSRVGDGGTVGTERISQFRLDGLPSDDLETDMRPAIRVLSYRLDVTLASAMTPSYSADMDIEVVEDSVRFLPFLLSDFQDTPDSVHTPDGRRWQVSSHRENPVVWLDAGRRLHRGERVPLHMHYLGVPLANWANLPTLHSSTNWYPIHNWQDRSVFDITFHYAQPMQLISVGDSVSREEFADGRIDAHWRTSGPIDNASWHIGQFHTTTARPDSLPEICMVNYAGTHARIGWEIHQSSIANRGEAVVKPVGNDVAGSLRFFQRNFGPLSARRLFAIESYQVHGQAFPGMIALDWTTFQATDPQGGDEVLRAHEVAHQWWGIEVGEKTYRDRWLVEGLSEFSGLWYMQVKRKDTALYLKTLSNMRERIAGTPFMPSAWLGTRAGQWRIYGAGYVSAIYMKGAWVFHMLRCMLLDLDSMDESRFSGLMHDYLERYR